MRYLTLLIALLVACSEPDTSWKWSTEHTYGLHTDRTYLRDSLGRYIYLNGVNLADTKIPWDTDPVTYVNRPVPEERADEYFSKIRDLGFNAVRFLVSWEGLEHDGPGRYDKAYASYIRRMVRKAGEYGLWVLIDFHQDLFSRHIFVKYNHHPQGVKPGGIEYQVVSLFPPYDDRVQGDGAPKWVVKACLPEKDMDSDSYGTPRFLGNLKDQKGRLNTRLLNDLIVLLQKALGGSGDPGNLEWLKEITKRIPDHFEPNETTDLLPLTNWGINYFLSLDEQRVWACMFASEKAFNDLEIQGRPASQFLQEDYARMAGYLAEHLKDLPNVVGYDLMNEPGGVFLTLTAASIYANSMDLDAVRSFLQGVLGKDLGSTVTDLLVELYVLPPDNKPETLEKYGLSGLNTQGLTTLLWNFDRHFLQPFYERVAHEILKHDKDAVIFFEPSVSLNTILSYITGGGQPIAWQEPMTRLRGVKRQVFAPHHYADVYPYLGINQSPRTFTPEEKAGRDYLQEIRNTLLPASSDMNHIPAVLGEFGTYFNFNGIKNSIKNHYIVSAHVLDNYYEALERLFASRFLWCLSTRNTYDNGDGWNHEDLSILDPKGEPRASQAFVRPVPFAVSGKPLSMHYYSPLHYYDPSKGLPERRGEFELTFESKETDAPTEVFVPLRAYKKGFFVFLSDGWATYDPESQRLYYVPEDDDPGHVHRILIRGPWKGVQQEDWALWVDPQGREVAR